MRVIQNITPSAITFAVLFSFACSPHAHATPSLGQKSQPLGKSLGEVYTDPGEIPQLQTERDGKSVDLPLEHTHVNAEVTGFVARVEVTQTYKNPYSDPLEAIYVFPLPENSAVDDMRIKIGDRVIVAEIQKQEDARKTYDQAKRNGQTAALLEQERPNIFTQSVANIEPGHSIDVVVSYLQTLTYDAGAYEFVFPMVVGPRFIPGESTGKSGSGWSPDTTQVPDASRISPPILGHGMRSGHDISLEFRANTGLPIRSWDVPTHQVNASKSNDGSLRLSLSPSDSIPNRDFVLRYHVDGTLPQATLLTHANDKQGGFFSLVIQPPKLDVDELVGQRELIFVLDVSGSMHGVPLDMGKDAMRHALRQLRPMDTFNVITFAGRTGTAFESPRPANQTHLKQAMEFIDGLRAGGGTQMLRGVQAALAPPIEPGRHRYVFFMTDGYIGNETDIYKGTQQLIDSLAQKGQRARVFGYGLGSSVNRALIDGIGKHGNGTSVYSSTREDPTLPVNTFFRYIDHPVLTDLDIDWGTLKVSDVFPTVKPDLFASRPTIIHGRYTGSGTETVRIRGLANGSPQSINLNARFPRREAENSSLATLWARSKIEDLERDMVRGNSRSEIIDSITRVGIDYRIVTAFTSFVAVDKERTVNGTLRTVVQPVESPEGVDPTMAAPGHSMLSNNQPMRKRSRSLHYQGSKAKYGSGYGSADTSAELEDIAPAPVPTAHVPTAPRPMHKPKPHPSIEKNPVGTHAGVAAELQQHLNRLLSRHRSGNIRTVTLKVAATFSRTGALLQPKIVEGLEALSAQEMRLILREIRRFQSKRAHALSGPKPLELVVVLTLN